MDAHFVFQTNISHYYCTLDYIKIPQNQIFMLILKLIFLLLTHKLIAIHICVFLWVSRSIEHARRAGFLNTVSSAIIIRCYTCPPFPVPCYFTSSLFTTVFYWFILSHEDVSHFLFIIYVDLRHLHSLQSVNVCFIGGRLAWKEQKLNIVTLTLLISKKICGTCFWNSQYSLIYIINNYESKQEEKISIRIV